MIFFTLIKLVFALTFINIMIAGGNVSAATNVNKPLVPPFDIEHFKPKKENAQLYGDYRKKWNRLSGFELSSLHWNQFVAVFINQAEDVYRNNYIQYLRTSQDDWDEDEDEDEREDEIREDTVYKTYPIGTILAKEGFDSSLGKPGTPIFISMMLKQPNGYDPEFGDWQYLKYSADGTTLVSGKASDPNIKAQCGACHLNVSERDFVFSTFYTGNIEKH